jgi:hypothetical protein
VHNAHPTSTRKWQSEDQLLWREGHRSSQTIRVVRARGKKPGGARSRTGCNRAALRLQKTHAACCRISDWIAFLIAEAVGVQLGAKE